MPPNSTKHPDNLRKAIDEYNTAKVAAAFNATIAADGTMVPSPIVTIADLNYRAKLMGFTQYYDFHPEHYGGENLEGQVNGTWYHLVIDQGTGNPYKDPPRWLQFFPQNGYYRPSGMHRIDWINQQLRKLGIP